MPDTEPNTDEVDQFNLRDDIDEPPADLEGMRAALTRANNEAKKYRLRAKENQSAQAELEELRQRSMSDQEKAVAAAKAEGRQEALTMANERLVRAEVKAAAAGRFANPNLAPSLIPDLDRFISPDGDVDTAGITKAIDLLLQAEPYLGSAARNVGSADGGARPAPSNDGDMNALIRRVAGRA